MGPGRARAVRTSPCGITRGRRWVSPPPPPRPPIWQRGRFLYLVADTNRQSPPMKSQEDCATAVEWLCISLKMGLDPFRTAVPFWGQTTQITSIVFPPNGPAVLKG